MRTLGKIQGTTKVTLTSGVKDGNTVYFMHKQAQERPARNIAGLSSTEGNVEMVAEPITEYGASEYSKVDIPKFGQQQCRVESQYSPYGDYTGSSSHSDYEYGQSTDADFRDVEIDGSSRVPHCVREARRVKREADRNRCRKANNGIERIVRDKLGMNLDSVDKIAEGITNLFK